MMWYENPLIVAYIALGSVVAIDLINLRVLVWLYRWASTVGSRLVGDVMKALNLKRGDNEAPMDILKNAVNTDKIPAILQSMARENPEQVQEVLQGALPQQIIQGIISGELKIKDIRQYVPALVQYFLSQGNTSQGNNNETW